LAWILQDVFTVTLKQSKIDSGLAVHLNLFC